MEETVIEKNKRLHNINMELRNTIDELKREKAELIKSKLSVAEVIKRHSDSDESHKVLMVVDTFETPQGVRIIVE